MRPRPQVDGRATGAHRARQNVANIKLCGTWSSLRSAVLLRPPACRNGRRHDEVRDVLGTSGSGTGRGDALAKRLRCVADREGPAVEFSRLSPTRGRAGSRTLDWAGTSTDAGGSSPPAPLRNPRLSEVPRTVLGALVLLYFCTLVHPSISMHPLRYCTLLLCPDALLSPKTLAFPLLSVDDHPL